MQKCKGLEYYHYIDACINKFVHIILEIKFNKIQILFIIFDWTNISVSFFHYIFVSFFFFLYVWLK